LFHETDEVCEPWSEDSAEWGDKQENHPTAEQQIGCWDNKKAREETSPCDLMKMISHKRCCG